MRVNQLSGRHLGDYILEERIGRGATADVYRAVQVSVNREVALKIVNPLYNLDDQNDFRRRFDREAKLIASLEHIHILPVHDYGVTADGFAYIAMRLMRGGSLEDLLYGHHFSLSRLAALFTQVADALHYAHERGVIHRDIKPSNVLLDEIGNAYVSDFGLAKVTGGMSMSLTKTGYIVGAPAYSSPEQLRDEVVDRRSDVYSLGVMLYYMLVGHTPFQLVSSGVLDVIDKQIYAEPPPPSQTKADLPPAVEAVVLRALRKNRSERYSTALEMADALNAAVKGKKAGAAVYTAPTSDSASDDTPRPVPIRWTRRPMLVGGAAALTVLIAAFVLLLSSQSYAPTQSATPITALVMERGTIADAAPNAAEIGRAQQSVGQGGFIALLSCTMDSQFQATRAREMNDLATSYDIGYRIYDARMDSARQAALIAQAISDGAKALIVCPLDEASIREPLQAAADAELPLIFLFPLEHDYDGVTIEPDNTAVGLLAGREAGRLIRDEMGGSADVIMLAYPGLSAVTERMDTMLQGLLEIAPEAMIVGSYNGGATRAEGYRAVSQLLADGIHFDVILSTSDTSALGAVQALEEAGIEPNEVAIVSVNGEPLVMQHIRSGYYLHATVELPRREFSTIAVNAAVKLLGGGAVPRRVVVEDGVLYTGDADD